MATGWSLDEVEATVADYFDMLRKELAGVPYSKTAHNERLRHIVRRSRGSVEFKHANVSAALTLHGYPYIDGYKPRSNFQLLLEQAVLEYIDLHRDFFDSLVTGPVLSPHALPHSSHLDPRRIVEDPPERIEAPVAVWAATAQLSRVDFVMRDAANREMGRRGEESIVEFEKKRLHDVERKPKLANRVEWVSHDRGDGAGYDILSFNGDGTQRLIEVKTTGLGKYFPFNVTANEVRCSEAVPKQFHLYRVFRFGERPRLYILPGSLSASCHLDPSQYRASVRRVGP